jgi:triacylglycerol lipase
LNRKDVWASTSKWISIFNEDSLKPGGFSMATSGSASSPFNEFKGNSNNLVLTNAFLFCMASRLAYFGEKRMEGALKNWGFSRGKFISMKEKNDIDTQLFVASNDKFVMVVFRGTQSKQLSDWMTDVKIRQIRREYYKGKVHRGFAEALQLVWPTLLSELKTHFSTGSGNKKLWLAGHSLGGGVATLAAQRFHATKVFPVAALYTYGCPRVGDPNFKKSFRVPSYRFENNNDIVPKVPTEILLHYRYTHVGSLMYLSREGELWKNPKSRKRIKDIARGRLMGLLEPGVDGVEDHGLDRYSALIKKQIQNPETKRRLSAPWKDFWTS